MTRGRSSVQVIAGPSVEPVTVDEVKLWAKIDTTEEDSLLETLIRSARQAAEDYCRRSFITQSVRLTLDMGRSPLDDCLGDGVYDLPVTALYDGLPRTIELPRGLVQSITSVTTYDTANASAVFSPSNYAVDAAGGRLMLNEGAYWPSPLRPLASCEVIYVCGYGPAAGSVPDAIKTAIKMHVQTMYDGRTICEMPEACMRLLRPYRYLKV
jgi:uncharacterized phiE125 gp8 family phage protein